MTHPAPTPQPSASTRRTLTMAIGCGSIAAAATGIALFVAGVGAAPSAGSAASAAPSDASSASVVVESFEASTSEEPRVSDVAQTPEVVAPVVEPEVVEPHVAASESVEDVPVTKSAERHRSTVAEFLDGFVDAHARGDVERLNETLHPSIRLAFGAETCLSYIEETVGSITAAMLVDVGTPKPLEMDTPHGPIGFEQAIPFTVDFITADGATVTNPANLPLHEGEVHWLTTCGVPLPVES